MAELRMTVAGSSPAQPPVNQVTLFAKSTDKRLYVMDDTGQEVKLVTNETTLSNLTAQLPLTSTGGSSPTIAINNVTQTTNGAMLYQDKLKLDNASASNTANRLVIRDALGNAAFNEVTATNFIGTASNVQTIPALLGDVTSNGTTNATTIASGVITNDKVSPTAAISLTKLAVNPTDRSTHIGSQTASTISDFNTAIDAHLTSTSPIVDAMIDAAAAIDLSKLATDPLDRTNHTGTQTASTISDFTTQVNTDIGNYLTTTPITNAQVDPAAAIALSKLALDPLNRANHTGTQTASTISDFSTNVAASLTAGDGIDAVNLATTGTIDVVGTVNRIDTSGGTVDIAATYAGQTSITTLGTINTGTWGASIIDQTFGGTGTSAPGEARNNLLNVNSITTSTTIDSGENVVIADCTTSIISITLPAATANAMFHFKKIDASANDLVIAAVGGDLIDGASSLTITGQYSAATIVSDGGTNWYILNQV